MVSWAYDGEDLSFCGILVAYVDDDGSRCVQALLWHPLSCLLACSLALQVSVQATWVVASQVSQEPRRCHRSHGPQECERQALEGCIEQGHVGRQEVVVETQHPRGCARGFQVHGCWRLLRAEIPHPCGPAGLLHGLGESSLRSWRASPFFPGRPSPPCVSLRAGKVCRFRADNVHGLPGFAWLL